MKKHIRNALIFLSPFLIMALINESVRTKIKEKSYDAPGITAINSAAYLPNKCTWICHNNTTYCKAHHVKYLKQYYSITDIFYFGAIVILESTGNYGAANIIFLLFLFPLMILYFIVKLIKIHQEIQKHSKQKP